MTHRCRRQHTVAAFRCYLLIRCMWKWHRLLYHDVHTDMHTQGSQHGTPHQVEAYIAVVLPAVKQGLLQGSHLALHDCHLSGGHSCGRAAGAETRCAMRAVQPGVLHPSEALLPPADFLQRQHSPLAMCLLEAGYQVTSHHHNAGWMQSHGTAPFVCRDCRCN